MKKTRLALFGSIWALTAGASLVTGCGDDSSDDNDPVGGRNGGGSGATINGGSGGRGGTGGGPVAGQGGKGGSAPQGGQTNQGGAGGSDVEGGEGGTGASEPVGGAGGSGGGDSSSGAVSRVRDVILTGVSDIRGITYASDGKIYASGHIGADSKTVDRELAVLRLKSDGTVDPTFGTGGLVRLNLVEREVETVPVGGEGGAGGAGGEGGGGGVTEVVVNDGDEQSLGIVELENGDVVVQANVRDAAGRGTDVVLVRLDDEGELVESFGTDGVQRIDFGWTEEKNASWTGATGPNDSAWGIQLDKSGADEKIVVFGFGPAKFGETSGNPAVQRTDNDRYVARVLAEDGSLDPEFNGGAVFSLHTGGTFSDGARRGIVEADGSILSSGYTNYGEGLGNHVVLIRLRPNGTLDPNFGFGIGTPGVLRSNPFLDDGGVAECYQVGKQSTGRYVTVGYGRATAQNGSSRYDWATTDAVDLVSFGFQPRGVDATYGRQGTLAIQSEEANLGNTEDRGRDLVVLPDDRVVHVGRYGTNPAIFVTTPDGEIDTASEDGGILLYEGLGGESFSHFYAVALSQDGRRIAATTSNHAEGVILALLEVEEE